MPFGACVHRNGHTENVSRILETLFRMSILGNENNFH